MRPILFQWHGMRIWSHPAMLYLGIVAGILAGNAAAHSAGIDAFRVYLATLTLVAAGLAGAKLLHAAWQWRLYRHNLRGVWRPNQAGAFQYGAVLLVLLASWPLLAALRLPFGAYWDAAVFTALITMIFGRIGCLLHGCCAGRPSESWMSVYLPNPSRTWVRRLPAQVLEAGWATVLLTVAFGLRRWHPFPGALFWMVVGGYAFGRLVLEFTREIQPGARFTIHHFISALLMVFSVAALAVGWHN